MAITTTETPMNRFALAFPLALSACVPVREHETVFVDEPIHAVEVFVDHGTVTLNAADDDERVRVQKDLASLTWNPASSQVEVYDGTLQVFASCGGEPSDLCTADHQIFVPREVAVLVSIGAGDLVVSGIDGEVIGQTGAGDLHMVASRGSFELETGAGDINLLGAEGPGVAFTDAGDIYGVELVSTDLVASTGAGDVDLAFSEVGGVDARSSAGDISLRVPTGRYDLGLATDAGDIRVAGVTDTPGATPLSASTKAGDIEVLGE